MSNSTDLLFKDIRGSFTTCQYIQQSPRMSTVKLIKKNNFKKFYNISSDLIVYLGKKIQIKGHSKAFSSKNKIFFYWNCEYPFSPIMPVLLSDSFNYFSTPFQVSQHFIVN